MRFFLDMSIKLKLLCSFFVVIILTLIIAIAGIKSSVAGISAASSIDVVLSSAYVRVSTAQEAVSKLDKFVIHFLNPSDSSVTREQFLKERPSIESEVTRAVDTLNPRGLGENPLYIKAMTDIKMQVAQYLDALQNTVMPAYEYKGGTIALATYLDNCLPIMTNIDEDFTTALREQINYASELTAAAADPFLLYVTIATAVIAVILAVLLAFAISNYIGRHMKEQTAIVNTIASGDFSEHIQQSYNDEFGQARIALRNMRNSLNKVIAMTLEVSNHMQEEMVSMQTLQNNIVSKTNDTQSQSVTVAAAADQMVSTTQDIARNCESAAAASKTARNITSNGMSRVREAARKIGEQSAMTKDNAAKIESLARQTHEIGSIVGTIDDIAAQTNLLALNAAIEAARAGEAGRGFAVVADEVRALASRTTKSTQEISKMVSDIQSEATMAKNSIDASVERMAAMADEASQVLTLLDDINSHVMDVNTQIMQIATAAEEQTTATAEISSNMQNITNETQEMAGLANRAHENMGQVVSEMQKLSSELSFFKLRPE